MAEQIAAPAVHAAPQRSAETVWYQPEQASLRLLTRLKFALARGFLLALAWLVGLRGLYLFGQAFGTCEWLINYRLRRRVRERLRYLLGEKISDKDLSRAVRRFFTGCFGVRRSSTSVFHSPQPGQRPSQRGLSWPQFWQTKREPFISSSPAGSRLLRSRFPPVRISAAGTDFRTACCPRGT